MVALIPAGRDGLTDVAVTYYGETEPAARLVEFSVAAAALPYPLKLTPALVI
jgi:hypothetical protein